LKFEGELIILFINIINIIMWKFHINIISLSSRGQNVAKQASSGQYFYISQDSKVIHELRSEYIGLVQPFPF